MNDQEIVSLYLNRDESAIEESQRKYQSYLHTVAYNVLYNHEDAKECVSDTYVAAWKSIPPNNPSSLRAFLSRIVRNLAINRYHRENAEKRKSETDTVIEEYYECIPDGCTSAEDEAILRIVINGFLASLPPKTRILFMQRYYYMCSVKAIAKYNGMSESNVKVTLMRCRENFRNYLEKEGYTV
jgi:RNA polymerase sigma-70 factor (ECF subfamily)